MIPGMRGVNPKQLQRMLRQQGIEMEEMDATEVIIKLADGRALVVRSPQVSKMKAAGTTTFQVVGDAKEMAASEVPTSTVKKGTTKGKGPRPKAHYTDEDLALVVDQTGASEAEARKALESCGGAPAEAIIQLLG